MSRVGDQSQWTAEQTLAYVNNMMETAYADRNVDEKERSETLYAALSISYEYLTTSFKRKITWSLSLEQLAYVFIELAFETGMHSSIKEVLKSYRSLTQGQYSDSLRVLLSNYRDKKLETMIQDEISEEDLSMIRDMTNIESDQVSADMILASLKPELRREASVRSKLKIVWEGYKSIVETVRVSQKLEEVYMDTLTKIFQFVERFNRKHEFKAFCKSLRSGLQNAFSKREKSEQQKAIYIDIVKTDVNTRNIQIRMEQFKVATKLGLWQEAFQILEDINDIKKVRHTPLKNNLLCTYYENLAQLFKRSNYWHYHAYACYCAHLATLTNPRLTQETRRSSCDRLALALLCVPPATLQLRQTKQSQEKICAMMISSTKIPSPSELGQLLLAKGVLDVISPAVRALWDFMSGECTLHSLREGLLLLAPFQKEWFKPLLQDVMTYRQLLWIAQAYECLRFDSLLRLVPLERNRVEQLLLECHQAKLIQFTLDQSQGVVYFSSEVPDPDVHAIYLQTALLRQTYRSHDLAAKAHRCSLFLSSYHDYFWNDRQNRIEDYRRVLKQPKQELKDREKEREREEKEKKEREEIERMEMEEKAKKFIEDANKLLAQKKMIINNIIAVKGKKTVRILEKKIENLTNQQIENLSLQTLTERLQVTQKKIANNKEARIKKIFTGVDYFQRERRQLISERIALPSGEEEQRAKDDNYVLFLKHSEEKAEHNRLLCRLANHLNTTIQDEIRAANRKYEEDLRDYKQKIEDNFRAKIVAKAALLLDQFNKKKELEKQQHQQDNLPFIWERKNMAAQSTKDTASMIQIGKAFTKDSTRQPAKRTEDTSQKWSKKAEAAIGQTWTTPSQKWTKKNTPQGGDSQKWVKGKNVSSEEMTGISKKANPYENMEQPAEKWTTGKNIIKEEPPKKQDKPAWKFKQPELAKAVNPNVFVPPESTSQIVIPKKIEKEALPNKKYINVNDAPTKKFVNVNEPEKKKEQPKKEGEIKKGKLV